MFNLKQDTIDSFPFDKQRLDNLINFTNLRIHGDKLICLPDDFGVVSLYRKRLPSPNQFVPTYPLLRPCADVLLHTLSNEEMSWFSYYYDRAANLVSDFTVSQLIVSRGNIPPHVHSKKAGVTTKTFGFRIHPNESDVPITMSIGDQSFSIPGNFQIEFDNSLRHGVKIPTPHYWGFLFFENWEASDEHT